jgi:hypothetical protein
VRGIFWSSVYFSFVDGVFTVPSFSVVCL